MLNDEQMQMLGEQAIDVLRDIYDPEIPVNIYELGLIYDLAVNEDADIKITMTLTSPNCPVAESLPVEVKERVKALDVVNDVEVELTFDPPWTKDNMSEEARLELGMF
jgi:FeS assembly SUF system protein